MGVTLIDPHFPHVTEVHLTLVDQALLDHSCDIEVVGLGWAMAVQKATGWSVLELGRVRFNV